MKINKTFLIRSISIIISLAFVDCFCETADQNISVFYNYNTPQHEFAAGDIKLALESKGFNVNFIDLSNLDKNCTGRKIIKLKKGENFISLIPN